MRENGLLKITDFSELDIPVDIQVAQLTTCTDVLRLLSEGYEGCVHKNPLRGMIEEIWWDAANMIITYRWKLDEPI
jgi:hypothetical protein